MIFALIPAGGRSERMGRPKLLLPLGGQTVLECVIAAFRAAKLDRILVVAAPHLPQLAAIAKTAGAEGVVLSQPTADMRGTVEFGLNWAEAHWKPQSFDAWFLSPADHPTLRPELISHLVAERMRNPSYSIFMPVYKGRRGHPALIDWRHVKGMRSEPPEVGVNVYLRRQEIETLEVKVDDPSILVDLDRPEDYERLLTSLHE